MKALGPVQLELELELRARRSTAPKTVPRTTQGTPTGNSRRPSVLATHQRPPPLRERSQAKAATGDRRKRADIGTFEETPTLMWYLLALAGIIIEHCGSRSRCRATCIVHYYTVQYLVRY
jgi:hypothetical protein